MYPASSLSILGSREFIREVTRHREPRRTRGRNDSGPKLPLPKLGEILDQVAGVTLQDLCGPHKGSRQQSEVRERLIYVATRRMFYAGMESARFLGVTSGRTGITSPVASPSNVYLQPSFKARRRSPLVNFHVLM